MPSIHRDPFDRILVGQATDEPAALYTANLRLPAYPHWSGGSAHSGCAVIKEIVTPAVQEAGMSVCLQHPLTRQIRVQPEGWSWGCCLGCGFLGLPLFRRGLAVWGAVMVALNMLALAASMMQSARAASLYSWLSLGGIALCVFFGLRANTMAIERYLARGWEMVETRRD